MHEFRTILQNLHDTLAEARADEVFPLAQQLMQNKSHLQTIRDFLRTRSSSTNRLAVHLVMTALVLHTRPDALFDVPPNTGAHVTPTLNQHQHAHAQLTHSTEQLVGTIRATTDEACDRQHKQVLATHLNTFKQHLRQWTTIDTHCVLQALAVAWIDIEHTACIVQLYNTDTLYATLEKRALSVGAHRTKLLAYVANRRSQTISQMAVQDVQQRLRQLELDFAFLASSVPTPTSASASAVSPPTSLEQTIESVVKRAFWDAFVARLDDKHTDQLALLLDELCHKLKQVTPSRHDIHALIDRAIDTSLIVQMVQHECMDTPHFLSVTTFVVDHLQHTQAPVRQSTTHKWYSEWKTTFHQGHHTFAQSCAQFLERAHCEIDLIMEACRQVRQQTDNTPSV
jgi:hypothetical protein